jgi:hypothetical protein
MCCCWDPEVRVEGSGGEAKYPCAIVPRGYCSRARGRGPAARAVRGAGNAGRRASPAADIPFNLLLN